jgi:hypothetical protein
LGVRFLARGRRRRMRLFKDKEAEEKS